MKMEMHLCIDVLPVDLSQSEVATLLLDAFHKTCLRPNSSIENVNLPYSSRPHQYKTNEQL